MVQSSMDPLRELVVALGGGRGATALGEDAAAFGEGAAFGGVCSAIDPRPFGGVIGRRDGIQDGCRTQSHRSYLSELLRICGELRTCGTRASM